MGCEEDSLKGVGCFPSSMCCFFLGLFCGVCIVILSANSLTEGLTSLTRLMNKPPGCLCTSTGTTAARGPPKSDPLISAQTWATSTSSTFSTIYVASTFPNNPLQTSDFSPPPSCSGVYLDAGGQDTIDDILTIGNDPECLPKNFSAASAAFYSPGTACPTGYTAQPQCSRNDGVHSITTVTCCPIRGKITLTCVQNALTLEGPWESQFCTWAAGVVTVVDVTLSESAGASTTTTGSTLSGADGINAYGIRYLYEASDLGSTSTTEPGNGSTTGSKGLSTGGTIAVAVVVPVLALALLTGLAFWWRRRKRRHSSVQPDAANPQEMEAKPGHPFKLSAGDANANVTANPQELAGQDEHTQVQAVGFPAELQASAKPVELPPEDVKPENSIPP
ncbi:hypothetical protein B0I35DRAFT_151587 [Stachybotrys elegans]|uniref:Uncharacterized protein n=1 Tax=Stachybotrys elegans TaxID=80388 RepID=A0A8K0SEQ9_9HYPO|nr:hypothetical protein B0I35DRAFT_151587 [Stachybotrys elegans]